MALASTRYGSACRVLPEVCQNFATRNLALPHAPIPGSAFHLRACVVGVGTSRWCEPPGALSRWYWGPSGSPSWPTAPGFASAPPPNLTRGRLLNPARTDLNPNPKSYRNSTGDPAWTNVTLE
jgi:hypothetical protein